MTQEFFLEFEQSATHSIKDLSTNKMKRSIKYIWLEHQNLKISFGPILAKKIVQTT